jgi:hypothetical protein
VSHYELDQLHIPSEIYDDMLSVLCFARVGTYARHLSEEAMRSQAAQDTAMLDHIIRRHIPRSGAQYIKQRLYRDILDAALAIAEE